MSDRKSPLDQALELLVYAPLGLALTARDQLPSLIERGRQQVNSQLGLARMMGQYAVAEGEKKVRAGAEQVASTVGTLLDQAQAPPATTAVAPPRPSAASSAAAGEPAPSPNGHAARPKGAAAVGDHLAITGYDTLSASQVVQRLAGLAPEELEAVRRYEEETRGRRTILSKVAQLQAEPTT